MDVFDIIVNFIIQKLKSKHTFLQKCKMYNFLSFWGNEWRKNQIFRTLVLNADMNVAIDRSAADIDLKVETEDYTTMENEKDGT